jgi:hypothetical protein
MGALLVDGRCPQDDRLSGNDPDCPPAAGDSLVVTTFDCLARSLPRCPSPPGQPIVDRTRTHTQLGAVERTNSAPIRSCANSTIRQISGLI